METRLAARAEPVADEVVEKAEVPAARDSGETVVAADVASRSLNGTESESINVWPDETAEASFMAEARERGEPIVATPTRVSDVEEDDAKTLPALEDLVNRLPAEVRESLDDLFRVKFTSVRRVPVKALKE